MWKSVALVVISAVGAGVISAASIWPQYASLLHAASVALTALAAGFGLSSPAVFGKDSAK